MKPTKPQREIERLSPYAVPGIIYHETPELLMSRIIAILGTTPERVRQRTRQHDAVYARAIIAYIVAERYPELSLRQIGEMVCQPHTVVIYYKNYIKDQIKVDKMFKTNYLAIKEML